MSDSVRNKGAETGKKSRRRGGNKGQEYEVLLPALFSLIFLEDATIKDFELKSNDNTFESLDDLIISLTRTDGSRENFAFQLKHKEEQNLKLCPECLEGQVAAKTKSPFGLSKYCQAFKKIGHQDYNFIIYTNAYFIEERFGNLNKFGIKSVSEHSGKELFFHASSKHGSKASIYAFHIKDETVIQDEVPREDYDVFFDKFVFYTGQKNCQELRDLIGEKFSRIFGTDPSFATAYISVFRTWVLQEFSNANLDKFVLKIKILDLILSPDIVGPTQISEGFVLLNEAFKKFDFVLLNDLDRTSVEKIVSNPVFEESEDLLYLAKEMKFVYNAMKDSEDIEMRQRVGYYCKGNPIFLRMFGDKAATFETTLLKLKEKGDNLHFVLWGANSTSRLNFSNFGTFETLSDLKNYEEIYHEIVTKMKISVLGEEYSYFELLHDNDQVAKLVTIKDIFCMLSGNFRLDLNEETLSTPHIPRSVSTTLVKTQSVEDFGDDILVITRYSSQVIENLEKGLNKRPVLVSRYLVQENVQHNFFLYQKDISRDDFVKICEKNPAKNVHHFFGYDEAFLQWVSTRGSIEQVQKFETSNHFDVSESEMHDRFQNPINVIVASPGMGKSEILKKLKNTSQVLPIIFSLKEHNEFFKTRHETDILQYLLNFSYENFIQRAVVERLADRKRIILFFDGLDELDPENIQNCLNSIKVLVEMGFKIWLSSRLHLKERVENYLNLFCLEIKAFSKRDQENYVRERLGDAEKSEIVIGEIFKNFQMILENREILEVPLQLYMICEIVKNCDISKNLLVLTKIFHNFLIGRYRHFFNKNKCGHWTDLEKVITDSIKYRKKQYQIVALHYLFYKTTTFTPEIDSTFVEELQTQGDFLGIISKCKHQFFFHHETFAEYFAALFFAENHSKIPTLSVILHENHRIRLLFDMILCENFPAHVAVLYRNATALDEHKNKIHQVDNGGRSPLHLACSSPCKYIVNDTPCADVDRVKNMREIDKELRRVLEFLMKEELLLQTDKVFGWNCLEFADRTGFLLPLEMILEKKYKDMRVQYLPLVTENAWGVMYWAALLSHSRLFRKVFEKLDQRRINQLLEIVVLFNDWKIMNVLLDHDVDVNCCMKNDRTVLHLAASLGHVELVTLLIHKHADVSSRDRWGRTPLHLATTNGHVSTVKELLKYESKLDSGDKFGLTPLHLAIATGNEQLVKFLIDEKLADVNRLTNINRNALHLAANKGLTPIVRMLLERNVNPEEVDSYGLKPVHVAAQHPNPETLKVLLKLENIDDVTSDGKTCLHLSAERGNVSNLIFLLQNGANINARDSSGTSVLHWAVINLKIEIVNILLENNVDVKIVDNNGRNCLQWAAELGDFSTAQLLLPKMRDLVNQKANNGSTALHWAANNGHNEIVELLLENGALIDAEDVESRSPLYWAALEYQVETVELLLGKNARNVIIGGRGALEFARTNRERFHSR